MKRRRLFSRWFELRLWLCAHGLHWPIVFSETAIPASYDPPEPPEAAWCCDWCGVVRPPYRFWWLERTWWRLHAWWIERHDPPWYWAGVRAHGFKAQDYEPVIEDTTPTRWPECGCAEHHGTREQGACEGRTVNCRCTLDLDNTLRPLAPGFLTNLGPLAQPDDRSRSKRHGDPTYGPGWPD